MMEFHSQSKRLPNICIIYPLYRQLMYRCLSYTVIITNGWAECYNSEVVELSLSQAIKTATIADNRLVWRAI